MINFGIVSFLLAMVTERRIPLTPWPPLSREKTRERGGKAGQKPEGKENRMPEPRMGGMKGKHIQNWRLVRIYLKMYIFIPRCNHPWSWKLFTKNLKFNLFGCVAIKFNDFTAFSYVN